MRYLLYLIFCLPGLCLSQQTLTHTISHDGQERSYILYVPANYTGTASVPLLFNFHGYTSNANDQMWYGDFREIADTAGFLVVHPQGSLFNGKTHFNVGGWTNGSNADDVGFTEALIDEISDTYMIDHTRIYATGMSNGGYMSFLLACQLSDRIAAVASVTGSMTPETFGPCNPSHATPVLQIHGTSDNVVPYDGETWSKSIPEVLEYWVGFNNCTADASQQVLPDVDSRDGSTAEHFVYAGGNNNSRVEHYKIRGGGHTWPGTANTSAGANQDINASLLIWNFFAQYDLEGLGGEATPIDPDERDPISFYPNPAQTSIFVERGSEEALPYQIISSKGKVVAEGILQGQKQEITISGLAASMYFLAIKERIYKILITE